jgi:hypothetical protein
MAKKVKEKKVKVSPKKEAPVELSFQQKFAQYAMQDIETIERNVGIGSSIDIPYRLPADSLVLNIVYGGGVSSGWYTLLGGEASSKSTNCISFLGECVRHNIPCYYFDGEGSVDGTYTPAICRVADLSDIFGLKNEKGKTEKYGCARYYDDTTMEKVFGVIKERLLNLPDKKYKKEKDQWYLVFDPSRKTHVKMMNTLGLKGADKSRKQVWCPVDSPDFQAVFMLDSYPAFIPEDIGEDEDKDSSGVALQAREYGKWVPQIKGLLRRKHCVIYGVNQLRDKPMVMYGKPTTEPCGNALKYFCFDENDYIFTSKGIIRGRDYKDGCVLSEIGKEKPALYKNFGKKACLTITTSLGYSMTGSLSHRVKTICKQERKNTLDSQWTCLSSLNSKHFIPIKYGYNVWGNNTSLNFEPFNDKLVYSKTEIKNYPKKLTHELARLLGYVLAEGFCREYVCSVVNKDKEIIDDIVYCCNKLRLPYKIKKLYSKDNLGRKYVYYVEIRSAWFRQFLIQKCSGNEPARRKQVPELIMTAPKEYVIDFLRCFMDCEGSFGDKQYSIALASRQMVDQIHLLLLNMGICGRKIYFNNSWHTPEDNRTKYAGLSLYGYNLTLFYDTVGCMTARKRKIIERRKGLKTTGKDIKYIFPVDCISYTVRKSKIFKYIFEYVDTGKKHIRHLDMRDLMSNKKDYLFYISGLRTEQERVKNVEILNSILNLCSYSIKNKIMWDSFKKSELVSSRYVCDFNMPKSHTVVVNGIVSHNSDVRCEFTSIAVTSVKMGTWDKGDSTSEGEEDSVEVAGGTDKYQYKKIVNTKNKKGTPFKMGYQRIWFKDGNGKGRGIDPVFDTWAYLYETGQYDGERRKKFSVNIKGFEGVELDWLTFKKLILAEVFGNKELKAEIKKLGIKPNLRAKCFEQIESGEYKKFINAVDIDVDDSDDDDFDEEDF